MGAGCAWVHRPPLPTLLPTNVQSLDNKVVKLRARISSQRGIKYFQIFTETWLPDKISDSAIQLETQSEEMETQSEETGLQPLVRLREEVCVCVFVSNKWCGDIQITDMEFLLLKCQAYYLLREFCAVFITAVYIPRQANSLATLCKLHDVISPPDTVHPKTVFITTGDFNHCNLRAVFPKYFQHVDIPSRDKNILEHVYSAPVYIWPHIFIPLFGLHLKTQIL